MEVKPAVGTDDGTSPPTPRKRQSSRVLSQHLLEAGRSILQEEGLETTSSNLTFKRVFDRVAHQATAREFAQLSGVAVQWVPGGHSWMLARPQGQVEVLRYLDRGNRYLDTIEDRWRRLSGMPSDRQHLTVANQDPPGMRIVS